MITTTTQNSFTGEIVSQRTKTIQNAFRVRTIVKLTVTRATDGRVTGFSGTSSTYEEPTSRARSQGCRKTFRYTDRMTGRLK
jgi:hypothetical protein